jgi:hypothetical protein
MEEKFIFVEKSVRYQMRTISIFKNFPENVATINSEKA